MGRKKKDKVEEEEVITTRTPRKWNPGLSIALLLITHIQVISKYTIFGPPPPPINFVHDHF